MPRCPRCGRRPRACRRAGCPPGNAGTPVRVEKGEKGTVEKVDQAGDAQMEPGDRVRVRNGQKWRPGTVVRIDEGGVWVLADGLTIECTWHEVESATPGPAALRVYPELASAERQVGYPTGDALDRAAVTQALWTRREAIGAAKKAYLVVAWQASDSAPAKKRGATAGDEVARADHGLPASDNVACFVYETPPQPSRSSFHADLRHLYDTVDHSQRIPVVVVDPAVRRNHDYTYLVVVSYPWIKDPPENP